MSLRWPKVLAWLEQNAAQVNDMNRYASQSLNLGHLVLGVNILPIDLLGLAHWLEHGPM